MKKECPKNKAPILALISAAMRQIFFIPHSQRIRVRGLLRFSFFCGKVLSVSSLVFEKGEKMREKQRVKIGLWSGLDYGGEGCREGLWHLAAEIFKQEKVDFVVLLGRLVDGRALMDEFRARKEQLKEEEKKRAVLERKKQKKPTQRIKKKSEKEKNAEVYAAFVREVGNELAKRIPRIPGVKIYMVTSPAYDLDIGDHVSQVVRARRKDVLLYRHGGDRFEITQFGKILGAYVPKKNVWMRGDYYGTPALRVLKDEIKRSTRGIGDINVVGGFASSIFNPGDSIEDVQKPHLTVPVVNKISESRTAENQIGIRILEATSPNLKEATVITYSFKDMVSEEWALVEAPPDSSKTHQVIVDALKRHGPLTIGMLVDHTPYDRKHLSREVKKLSKRRASVTWPGIYLDELSKRYYFNLDWFREKLQYAQPKGKLNEDSFLAFSCLHTGCRHTDMKFFCETVARLILEKMIDTLIGCGDFIEGLKHDLWLKGEVYGHQKYVFNYTKQEKLSAFVVGTVMLKVFEERVRAPLRKANRNSQAEVEKVVSDALISFYYIAGNHCEWTLPLGFDSLVIFRHTLKDFLMHHISIILGSANLCSTRLMEIISSKVRKLRRGENVMLPSKLGFSIFHPHMSRTKTPSIRPQQMLQKANTQLVFGGNFHVAEAVEEWERERGQRVCLELGTLKHRSGFEEDKLKTVDFGVGVLRVGSLSGRIYRTETAFYGTPTKDIVSGNLEVLERFDEWLEKSK